MAWEVVSRVVGDAKVGVEADAGLMAGGRDGRLGGGIETRSLSMSVVIEPGRRVLWAAVDGQGGEKGGLLQS